MKFLCYFGLHSWDYKKEKHKVENHPSGREFIRLIVRECENCGKREWSNKNLKKSFGFYWKKCNFDKDSVINIKEIK